MFGVNVILSLRLKTVLVWQLLLPLHCVNPLNIHGVTSGEKKFSSNKEDILSSVYLEPSAVCFQSIWNRVHRYRHRDRTGGIALLLPTFLFIAGVQRTETTKGILRVLKRVEGSCNMTNTWSTQEPCAEHDSCLAGLLRLHTGNISSEGCYSQHSFCLWQWAIMMMEGFSFGEWKGKKTRQNVCGILCF